MIRMFCFLVTAVSMFPVEALAQAPLGITDITANGRIAGIVSAPAVNAGESCVVVYVHTDIWYIHPYAAGGEGRSWAKITGKDWSIPTVKREFPANQVAAILLRKNHAGDCPAPAKLESIDAVERIIGAPFVKPLS